MKTVDELVSDWTVEESERLRDLIDECREREKALIAASKASQEILSKMKESETALIAKSSEWEKKLQGIVDTLLGIFLRMYKKKLPSC